VVSTCPSEERVRAIRRKRNAILCHDRGLRKPGQAKGPRVGALVAVQAGKEVMVRQVQAAGGYTVAGGEAAFSPRPRTRGRGVGGRGPSHFHRRQYTSPRPPGRSIPAWEGARWWMGWRSADPAGPTGRSTARRSCFRRPVGPMAGPLSRRTIESDVPGMPPLASGGGRQAGPGKNLAFFLDFHFRGGDNKINAFGISTPSAPKAILGRRRPERHLPCPERFRRPAARFSPGIRAVICSVRYC
jgi:hypothetical protein